MFGRPSPIVGSKTTKAPYDLAEHTHFHGDAYTDGQLIETTTAKRGVKSVTGRSKRRDRPPWSPRTIPSTGGWCGTTARSGSPATTPP